MAQERRVTRRPSYARLVRHLRWMYNAFLDDVHPGTTRAAVRRGGSKVCHKCAMTDQILPDLEAAERPRRRRR